MRAQPSPSSRGKRDGRDRTDAKIIGSYDACDVAAGRLAEQNAMNAAGGIAKLDNKRNEIRADDWEKKGVAPPKQQ